MNNRLSACSLALIFLLAQPVFSQTDFCEKKLAAVVAAIASDNPQMIAEYVRFPLFRRYPVPPIVDADDFVRHYREIFDTESVTKIARSDLKKDWSVVGWHGLQYADGSIALDNESDYRIIEIHHETEAGKKRWEDLVSLQRRQLPEQFREFDVPVLDFKTETHRFRVDQIEGKYRLIRFLLSDPPSYDLVLENGEISYDGNLGDFHLDWSVRGTVYRIQTTAPDDHEFLVIQRLEQGETDPIDDGLLEHERQQPHL